MRVYIKTVIRAKEYEARGRESEDDLVLLAVYKDAKDLNDDAGTEKIGERDLVALKAYTEEKKHAARERMMHIAALNLRRQLEAVSWPSLKLSQLETGAIQDAITKSLQIYRYETDLPDQLVLFQVLTESFRSRFLYHFDSNRPTNRLDKPEWFLQHVVALAEEYNTVLSEFVQARLNRELPQYTLFAPHEFLRSMMPMVTEKLQATTRQVKEDMNLLIHLILETKNFDDTLRHDFGYRNRDLSSWTGLSAVVLSQEVFETWLSYEDSFARKRFHEIVDENEAFEISGDMDTFTGVIAPNPSSLKIIDLFEALTKTFAPLEDVTKRQAFVDTIQVVLLDSYLEKIRKSTDAFDELVNGFSGAFPVADIAGKPGLQRLCRQLSGVVNVLDKLKEWNEEPFYVELDHEIKSCFDTQIDAYLSLRERIEDLIVKHLQRELAQELRSYSRLRDWSKNEASEATIASTKTSSTELIRFYETIDELFSYLATVGSPVLLHRLYHSVAPHIDTLLWTNVVAKNKFSRRGALQLKRDILQMWFAFSPYVIRPEPGMRRMGDVLLVLSDGSDAQEAAALDKIESATNDASMKEANITTLSPQEVESLLDNKLYQRGSEP